MAADLLFCCPAPAQVDPPRTPAAAFAERRRRVRAGLSAPALVSAGLRRPRNYPANPYPFRAESHYAYLVGPSPSGAVLLLSGADECLYVPERSRADELWSGPQPGLADLEAELGLRVRPLRELVVPPGTGVLPPQDALSASFIERLVGRPVQTSAEAMLTGPDLELADAMIAVRLVHDQWALAQIEQAIATTAAAHRAGMAATRPSLPVRVVRAAMEGTTAAHGMAFAYGPIVTVRGDVLHPEESSGVLAPGDLLLADFGAESVEGWASDVTRTWPVGGHFSPTQRAVYEVVLAAQQAAILRVAPGVRFLDVHRTAQRVMLEGLCALGLLRGSPDSLLERDAAALFFPHGIGHLLGLDVHDMEDLGDRAGYAQGRVRGTRRGDQYLRLDRDLVSGMVVTIEPGFYLNGALLEDPAVTTPFEDVLDRTALARFGDVRGIRIEDDVLVTPSGRRVLTEIIPKQLADVEAAVGVALGAPMG